MPDEITNEVKTRCETAISDAIIALAWNSRGAGYAAAYMGHLRERTHFVANDRVQTAGVSYAKQGGWKIEINPQFFLGLTKREQQFLLAHETQHVAWDHVAQSASIGLATADGFETPGKERESKALGLAQDLYINDIQLRDKVGDMPEGGVTLQSLNNMAGAEGANPYTGAIEVLPAYYWILGWLKAPENEGEGEGEGPPAACAGCRPGGRPGEGPVSDDASLPAMVQASAREAGTGSALAEAIKAQASGRTDWKSVIGDAFEEASHESANREERTYSRANRRESLDPDIMRAGKQGTECNIAVIYDVSGSVSRELVAQSVGETLKLLGDYPQARVFVASHTSKLEASLWLEPDTDAKEAGAKLSQATARSGGTDPEPAYKAVRDALPRFDVVVHFTDGEFFGEWPTVPPCARFVVGLCGAASVSDDYVTTPPAGTKIVKVSEG